MGTEEIVWRVGNNMVLYDHSKGTLTLGTLHLDPRPHHPREWLDFDAKAELTEEQFEELIRGTKVPRELIYFWEAS